jgi:rRNA maturation RNase YbeY
MPGTIRFFSEQIEFKVPQPNRIRHWLRQVAEAEGTFVNELIYVFCSDEYLHRMNVEFLDHDTYTDIITFDLAEDASGLTGEFYISIERVIANADKYRIPFLDEVLRVMVHGMLHLCGYSDKSPEDIKSMRNLETIYLSKFKL